MPEPQSTGWRLEVEQADFDGVNEEGEEKPCHHGLPLVKVTLTSTLTVLSGEESFDQI